MVHLVLLLVCAVVIYLACEWFVNAVEWLGVQLRVGPIAVGTVLAAVGTALPESVVTLVAVTLAPRTGSSHGADIGVGAALGGPLVVGTIAYAVVGATLLLRRRDGRFSLAGAPPSVGAARAPERPRPAEAPAEDELAGVDSARLARDQVWFLAIFAVKLALGLVAFAIKPWLGVAFFLAYGVYFWRELRGGDGHGGEGGGSDAPAPLRLQPRRAVPHRAAVVAQTTATLIVIFVASQLFVRQLEWAGPVLGLPPVVVALLLAPVATELPEIMNALIWVRQGKTELALANISGAMMIQATIPSGLGLLFTPWLFGTPLVLAGAATVLAVTYLLTLLRTGRLTAARLAAAALFYSAFALALGLTL